MKSPNIRWPGVNPFLADNASRSPLGVDPVEELGVAGLCPDVATAGHPARAAYVFIPRGVVAFLEQAGGDPGEKRDDTLNREEDYQD